MKILVQGWLNQPHPFTAICINQLLCLANEPNVILYFENLIENDDKPLPILQLTPEQEFVINKVKRQKDSHQLQVDAVYRISYPYDVTMPKSAKRLILYYHCPYGHLSESDFADGSSKSQFITLANSQALVPLTSSKWSSRGLLNLAYKFAPAIIPLGYADWSYKPKTIKRKIKFRKEYRIPDTDFCYLSVTTTIGERFNLDGILTAFFRCSLLRDNVHLIIKTTPFGSPNEDLKCIVKKLVADKSLPVNAFNELKSKITLITDFLDNHDMCDLFVAGDCLLAPYKAKAFGVTILEALACGLPCIIPKSGPTDDFTDDTCCLYTQCLLNPKSEKSGLISLAPVNTSILQCMIRILDDDEWLKVAKKRAPCVASNLTWAKVSYRLIGYMRHLTEDGVRDMEKAFSENRY